MSVSSLSNQSVTIQNPSGTRDKHGQAAYGAAATAYVRFERTYKTIKTPEREREPIHAIVGLPADITITRGSKVTYGSEVYRVIDLAEAIGPGGSVHHREAMLQLWSYA